MGAARLCESRILACIWHSDLHFAAHGCTQPHMKLNDKTTKVRRFRSSQGLTYGF